MRFGITPLYIDHDDISRAAAIIKDVVNQRLWDQPEYFVQARVT